MRKKLALLLAIIVVAILSSCSLGGGRMFSNDDKIIDDRFQQIVDAIENHDTDALISMFSAQALAQAVDFEEQITSLLEFIQGDIDSWKRTGGPGVSEGKNDDGSGRVWKEMSATYDIQTSAQKYHVSLKEITKDSQNSNKVGVSSLCIINAEDWHEEYNYWGDLGTLGINVDFKKNDMP